MMVCKNSIGLKLVLFVDLLVSLWCCASRDAIWSATTIWITKQFFEYHNLISQERKNQSEDWFSRFWTRELHWCATRLG
jgi:hypothetical protein